ncbi:hypothetical protein L596_011137 [Steinernema carpocapsae]|nr:hypothetical protein L596_011137 [Steinernema carpocapsae]
MLQLIDGVVDEKDNSQVFIPFLNEVRVGSAFPLEDDNESVQGSPRQMTLNFDDYFPVTCSTSGANMNSSPSVQAFPNSGGSPPNSPLSTNKPADGKELQVEYWTSEFATVNSNFAYSGGQPTTPQKKDSNAVVAGVKWSMKSSFRQLCVTRKNLSPLLSLSFVKHQKRKDKVLHKLGIRDKNRMRQDQPDVSSNQNIPNVTRMICSGKHSNLKIAVDGSVWSGVKFFQVGNWQTHVKFFPICIQISLPSRSSESSS